MRKTQAIPFMAVMPPTVEKRVQITSDRSPPVSRWKETTIWMLDGPEDSPKQSSWTYNGYPRKCLTTRTIAAQESVTGD